MNLKKIKKKPLVFLLIIPFIGIIAGTFAYYYSEISISNEFKTMTYNVQIEEEFNNTWGTKKVNFVNKSTRKSK